MRALTALRPAAAVAALVIASALATGCSSSSPIVDSGCSQTVLGVTGTIRLETSGLSCGGAKKLIGVGVSPGGGPYLVKTSPGTTWKCRTRGKDNSAPLLRCERADRHFSVIPSP